MGPYEDDESPVEDFYILKDSPDGEYIVDIVNFDGCYDGGCYKPTPFAVHIVRYAGAHRESREVLGTYHSDPEKEPKGTKGLIDSERREVARIAKIGVDITVAIS